MARKALIFLLLLLCVPSFVAVGRSGIEEFNIRTSELREDVEYLAGEETAGRGFGTMGHQHAAFYLVKRFESAGLLPVSGNRTLSFRHVDNAGDTIIGHNIIGMLESGDRNTDRCIVIGAYYDGLGTIKGKIYPGADSNASGLAAMIQLAKSMRMYRNEGEILPFNILFVAFDGRRCDRAGSKALWEAFKNDSLINPVSGGTIREKDINLMIDLDQMGSSLAPVNKDRSDYMIVLGEDRLPEKWQGLLNVANNIHGYAMDLNKSYYGSERFSQSFYNIGDRKIFIQNGIPTLFFTSGITSVTNRTDDNPQNMDFPCLRRRTIVIFRFLKILFDSIS